MAMPVSRALTLSVAFGAEVIVSPASAGRCVQYRARKVTTIAAIDGKVKVASHRLSGGMSPLPNITKFAGFEIGKTKLAALAMNAQVNR